METSPSHAETPSHFISDTVGALQSVAHIQIVMKTPRMHSVKVVMFSSDDRWMRGCELGQELWITEPVCSEQALGKV